jgi:hypothetical protein
MVLSHGNALIFQRKFFLLTVKIRPSSRLNLSLLISKGNLRDSNFAWLRQLSLSIGRFLRTLATEFVPLRPKKDRQPYITSGCRRPPWSHRPTRQAPARQAARLRNRKAIDRWRRDIELNEPSAVDSDDADIGRLRLPEFIHRAVNGRGSGGA